MGDVAAHGFDARTITRPDPALMRYYVVMAALTLLGFPFVLLAHYCRYISLRYRFDDEESGGVWMRWGVLFRKEVSLTYRRIQDIHVTRNIIQRWMGLATVSIQTAAGSSSPEMTIEGVMHPDALRDFLYERMRGARGQSPAAVGAAGAAGETAPGDEALVLLHQIRDAVRETAARLARLEADAGPGREDAR